MPKYSRGVVTNRTAVSWPLAVAALHWCCWWKTCTYPPSTQLWFWILILQLQGFLQCCVACSCRCRLQIYICWCGLSRQNKWWWCTQKQPVLESSGQWLSWLTPAEIASWVSRQIFWWQLHPKSIAFLSSWRWCFSTREKHHEALFTKKSFRWEKDLQLQAFQSTTDQWECFWHFDKQVWGIFNCYMYKARECCQYCPLCNSSAQLFKIKSSRKVHPHWGPWHGELQWCGKWRFLEAWRCYNPICKCPKFSKGKATKEGRGNEGPVMQLPQWSRPSSMAVECLNLTFKTVSKLQILCNCDRCTKVFFWIREVFLHIFK